MIVREYIKCKTCDYPHMVRVQVGVNSHQEHVFNCMNCTVPIKLALNTNEVSMSAAIEIIDNCAIIDETECEAVYLCTDFVANKEDINNPLSFPSGRFVTEFVKKLGVDQLQKANEKQKGMDILSTWNDVKRIWLLRDAGKFDVMNAKIVELFERGYKSDKDFEGVLFQFYSNLMGIDEELLNHIRSIQKTNDSEFNKFLLFYKTSLREKHLRSQRDLLTKFFDAYKQFSQILPYVRKDIPFPNTYKATLMDFGAVNNFYASAFEYFSDALVIFTALNNIKENRPFDQLKQLTLDKWLNTDKGKRRDNFSNNSIFTNKTQEFDNGLRNAFFHNWIALNNDSETLEYQLGGKGALVQVTYTEYLYRCGVLLKQICLLATAELVLFEAAQQKNIYTFNIY